ncbi:MAG TPA: CPBP family glutamic-type intramembrane protease [Pseudomonadales bacterium]
MTSHPRWLRSLRSGEAILDLALAGFLLWTFATWLLDGRIRTLLRPEAELDRLLYAGIVNIAIGQIGGLALLRLLIRSIGTDSPAARLRPREYRFLSLSAAIVLGLGYYAAAGGGFGHAAVMVNTFAQVFVVSAAEVIACWGLVGLAAEARLRPRIGNWSPAGGAIAASCAFGLYHFAHSPPFNTPAMAVFLTMAGLITSLFFFVSRDLLATIVFHNFPAVAGVAGALAERDDIGALSRLEPLLLATATLSLLVVMVGERVALADRR